MTEVTAGTAGHHHRIVAATGRSALFFAAFLLAFAAAMLAWGSPASAMPASETVVPLKQPDGEVFDARQYGDEWNHGYETRDGYTVVRNPETKAWEYAVDAAGSDALEPSGRVAGEEAPPEGVDKHLRPEDVEVPEVAYPEPEREMLPSSVRIAGEEGEMEALASTGEHKSLVILVQFTDQGTMGTTAAQWNSKFFGASDSMRDYYQKASYGKLNIGAASESHGTANDGVVGWLNLPYNHPNTANFPNGAADRKLTADAVKAADAYVNYKAFDTNNDGKLASKELHVTVIAAGQEGACCRSYGKAQWGHFWSLLSTEQPTVDGVLFGGSAYGGGYTQFGEYHRDHMATLGVMVHEMGHDLGLPDLYDPDGSSEGVGDWSGMGSGPWNTVSGQYGGAVPAFPDAWSRYYEGWLTPKREVGAKSVPQAETSDTVYQLHENAGGLDWVSNVKSGTGEYFLIENRQKTGYDAGLPGCGLLVWHIDESRTYTNNANANDAQRLVDLEEADNHNHLDFKLNQGDAGDPFPGTMPNGSFHDISTPDARLYDGRFTGTAMEVGSGCSSSMSATFEDDGVPLASANDAFASAREIILSNNAASLSGTNVGATKEAGEPNHANNAGGESVWYKWTAPSNGKMTVDTRGSTTASNTMLDTTLGVYTGSSVGGLTQIGTGNDDEDPAGGISTSKFGPFTVTAGTTYRIAVDGYNNGTATAEGNVSLNAAFTPAPSDTLAPTVLSSAPAPEKTGVGRKSNVRVTFNEAMQRTTLNKFNVTLYRNGSSTPVSATVAPSSDNKSATLNPYGTTSKVLAARAWYEVVLWRESTGGVRDANGNLLQGAGPYPASADGRYVSFWFKTAG